MYVQTSHLNAHSERDHRSIIEFLSKSTEPCQNPAVYKHFPMHHEFCVNRSEPAEVRLHSWDRAIDSEKKEVSIDIVGFENRDENGYHMGLITGNRIEYAMKHNYNYYFTSEIFQKAIFLHPAFNKLAALEQILNDDLREKQWVVWMDNDTLITNMDIKFENIIQQYANQDTEMIIARDLKYDITLVNTGVFLIRNSEWTRKFLADILHTELVRVIHNREEYGLEDQEIIVRHLLTNQEIHYDEDDGLQINRRVSIIPTRSMNSFCRPYEPYLSTWDVGYKGTWEPGDFIAHFTGQKDTGKRYRAVSRLLDMFARADGEYRNAKRDDTIINPCKVLLEDDDRKEEKEEGIQLPQETPKREIGKLRRAAQ